jgi:hypothetical protein
MPLNTSTGDRTVGDAGCGGGGIFHSRRRVCCECRAGFCDVTVRSSSHVGSWHTSICPTNVQTNSVRERISVCHSRRNERHRRRASSALLTRNSGPIRLSHSRFLLGRGAGRGRSASPYQLNQLPSADSTHNGLFTAGCVGHASVHANHSGSRAWGGGDARRVNRSYVSNAMV